MRRPLVPLISLAAGLVALAGLAPRASHAESWCAYPLWVHEWGVEVFAQGGARRLGADAATLPPYFHDAPPAHGVAVGPPVRGLPVDGGERELPILQFYTSSGNTPVPVGLEVGFAQGEATSWYPQVDVRRRAADANGAAARTARQQLVAARAARRGHTRMPPGPALLPADPTRQLEWDALSLADAPTHARADAHLPWVDRLRAFPDALWANSNVESERFVFYEARTSETAAVRLERGPTYAPGHRHFLLHNVSHDAVHSVFLVHREGDATFVFYAPSIPAGATAGLLLEDHRVDAAHYASATRDQLRHDLVDAHEPRAPREYSWGSECVMMRDPAQPFDAAESHTLYAPEVDAILDVWGARFFDAPGTTLVWREDVRTLDAAMPLSIYTDMYHFVKLHRAGLAVVENTQLP